MTVSELKHILSQYPDDMKIMVDTTYSAKENTYSDDLPHPKLITSNYYGTYDPDAPYLAICFDVDNDSCLGDDL